MLAGEVHPDAGVPHDGQATQLLLEHFNQCGFDFRRQGGGDTYFSSTSVYPTLRQRASERHGKHPLSRGITRMESHCSHTYPFALLTAAVYGEMCRAKVEVYRCSQTPTTSNVKQSKAKHGNCQQYYAYVPTSRLLSSVHPFDVCSRITCLWVPLLACRSLPLCGCDVQARPEWTTGCPCCRACIRYRALPVIVPC